jgi:hypothetical protein
VFIIIIIIINNIIVTGTITKKRLQHVAMKHSFYSSKNCLAILAAQMRPPFVVQSTLPAGESKDFRLW